MNEDYLEWLIEKILEYIPHGYTKIGSEINCKCPICGDSKKNKLKRRGYLDLKTGRYYCHNCGASFSSGLGFLSVISGENYSKIRGEYMKMKYSGNGKTFVTTQPTQNKVKKATDFLMNTRSCINPEWKSPLSDRAKEYLAKRKVDQAPFLSEQMYSFFDKNQNEYILIPWIMNCVESYFQLNDFQRISKSGMKYIFPKNREKLIYGMDNIDMSWKHIIVTEGVYDSLFIPNCVCSGGKYLTDLQYEILRKRFPNFEISLSFDNDAPGISAMKSAIEKFGRRYSYFIWFNDKIREKDINDYVLAKDNVNYFADKSKVESMIFDQVLASIKLR